MEILDYLFEKGKDPVDQSDLPEEKTVLDGFEAIRSLLTFTSWKGEPRQTSTLSISWVSDGWTARLIDGDNLRSSTYTGKSVAEAIEGLDAQLVSKQPRWYYWKERGPAKKNVKLETSSNGSGKRVKSPGK